MRMPWQKKKDAEITEVSAEEDVDSEEFEDDDQPEHEQWSEEDVDDDDLDADLDDDDELIDHRSRFSGFTRAEKITMGAAAAVGMFGLISAVSAVVTDEQGLAQAQAQEDLIDLRAQRDEAAESLDETHSALLEELPGHSTQRYEADVAAGEDLVADLAGSLGATTGTDESRHLLITGYKPLGLDQNSTVFTQLLPELIEASAQVRQPGEDPLRYSVGEIQVLPMGTTAVAESEDADDEALENGEGDRQYVVQARLDPLDDEAAVQYVLLKYTTDDPGHFDEASGDLASQATAQRLAEQD